MPVSPPFPFPAIVPDYWDYTTLSFNRSAAYPSDSQWWNVFPNDVRVYDINADGHLDVLQIYSYIPDEDIPNIPIRVLLGDGHGGFTDGTSILFPGGAPLANAATGCSVADFNGDGVLDIFISMTWETASPKDAHNLLLLSDGSGGVIDASATLPDINDYSHWSSAADIDGDHDIDIFVCNIGGDQNSASGDTSSYFLINDGTGHFTRSDTRLPTTIETGYRQYTSSLLFDADGDGDNDLLLGMWGPQAALQGTGAFSSLVLFNDGSGHFTETADSPLPPPLFSLENSELLDMQATDLNGDGHLDLLLLMDNHMMDRDIQVLINNGDGTFHDESAVRLSAYEANPQDGGRYMHLADINGDGLLDLMLQTGGQQRFWVNDGNGYFVALPPDFLFTNGGSYAFVPGDFDEDGRIDVFIRNFVNNWDDPANVTEFDTVARWSQPAGATLTGDGADNAILGIGISETLNGQGGNDILFGGAGDDRIFGGAGSDQLVGGLGADAMFGGTGDDVYVVDNIRDRVVEYAGEGIDRIRSSITTLIVRNVEQLELVGAALNGSGNGLDNLIIGNGLNNLLSGRTGNDTLDGGDGNDWLDGGAGADQLLGGAGDDVYVIDNAGDTVIDTDGNDTVRSYIGYQLNGQNGDNIILVGSSPNNAIGDDNANLLRGNAAANMIAGNGGADNIYGEAGNDTIFGGAGNDRIVGGAGIDQLWGEGGADKFLFDDGDIVGATLGSADVIHDFNRADGDRIYLNLMDANINTVEDDAFTFIGSAAFSGTAGELRVSQYGDDMLVRGDIDGDGNADFMIIVSNATSLVASDFIF